MSLKDWKWDAEQYRDIDRAAQEEAEKAIAEEEAKKKEHEQKPK
jgi:hypothetical protein